MLIELVSNGETFKHVEKFAGQSPANRGLSNGSGSSTSAPGMKKEGREILRNTCAEGGGEKAMHAAPSKVPSSKIPLASSIFHFKREFISTGEKYSPQVDQENTHAEFTAAGLARDGVANVRA